MNLLTSRAPMFFIMFALIGSFLVVTSSTISFANEGGSVTEPVTVDVVCPPEQEGCPGFEVVGACANDVSVPSWAPLLSTPSNILSGPGVPETFIMGLEFVQGQDEDCGFIEPSGDVTSSFDIDDANNNWQETSSCFNSCDANTTGSVSANFVTPEGIDGVYTGTFSVTWTP